MRRKPRNITGNGPAAAAIAALVLLWQTLSMTGVLPAYMLPGPVKVVSAFIRDFPLLLTHLGYTLYEALAGLALSIIGAFLLALLMDASPLLKAAIRPALLLTQTMPTIAIAPLLVLWLGYGMTPKIALVFLTCFFPMTIALLDGFARVDPDAVRLLQAMGAVPRQLYRYVKLPAALPAFFSGLKISSSYAIIGAVVSEWLGGNAGLGVYMTRVRKSYAFDKMFAVILLTATLSLLLMRLVTLIERRSMPWLRQEQGSRLPAQPKGGSKTGNPGE